MGSGQGKTRRARLQHNSPAGATADFNIWQRFVDESELARTPASEYYGITLPDYGDETGRMSAARCHLATELLRDFVATGAITLPKGVELDEFSFYIYDDGLMLQRSVNRADGSHRGAEDVVTTSTSKLLHNTLELGHKGIRALFSQIRSSVFALTENW
jgi:hypothetical protein